MKVCQGEFFWLNRSQKFLRGREKIFSEDGIVRKEVYVGGLFYIGETLHGGVFGEGREFFIEVEPDLPVLLEKNDPKSNIKTENEQKLFRKWRE